jgi:acyl-CoA ligase (AMP-forming) (exosortase A-associated)
MRPARLLPDLSTFAAERTPDAIALRRGDATWTYATLAAHQNRVAGGLMAAGVQCGDHVAICLSKTFEFVAAAFGATQAGAVFVPINPVLRPEQVIHALADCEASVMIASPERFAALRPHLGGLRSLRLVVIVGTVPAGPAGERFATMSWGDLTAAPPAARHGIDNDLAAILYTSGSTGLPKGVCVSHRNLVTGAQSVAATLDQRADDVLLAALPLSFDAGFSQLTTAFAAGAQCVLLDYLLPGELLSVMARTRVTGLTAVPPLWCQLADQEWPEAASASLRYFANTGGKLPGETLHRLRALAPGAKPFLMYGLTEAFRSTILPPDQVAQHPNSIGRAIPNQEVCVLRDDGTRCGTREVGEIVHRGSTVALGYWRDPARTAERFRPCPSAEFGVLPPETCVFSGDYGWADEDGFLYFIGRHDDMIKSSGYRISPTEVEDLVHATGLVSEAAAVGVPDARLGQSVWLVAAAPANTVPSADALMQACRRAMPPYMVPARIDIRAAPLPRNPNGKIDRAALAREAAARAERASWVEPDA